MTVSETCGDGLDKSKSQDLKGQDGVPSKEFVEVKNITANEDDLKKGINEVQIRNVPIAH